MNKLIKTILLGVTLLLPMIGLAANELNCTQSQSSFSNCTIKYMYLFQDNNGNGLPDYLFPPTTNYIYPYKTRYDFDLVQLMTSSNIEYFMSTGNMLSTKDAKGVFSPIDNNLFILQSWVFEYNQPVRAIGSTRYLNVEIPTLTGIDGMENPMIGIKNNLILKTAEGYDGKTTSNYRRSLVSSIDDMSSNIETSLVKNLRKRKRSNSFTSSSCINYMVQRCGDGKISTHTGYVVDNKFYPVNSRVSTNFTGEVCDDGEDNGKPGKCNLTCDGYVNAGGYCGDGVIDSETNLPPQNLLDGLHQIVRDLLIGGVQDNQGYPEMCDDGMPDPENNTGNGYGGNCSLSCTVESDVEPDIIPDDIIDEE